jgi:hypothetical protein
MADQAFVGCCLIGKEEGVPRLGPSTGEGQLRTSKY